MPGSETRIMRFPTPRGTNCQVISAQATISMPEKAATISFHVQSGEEEEEEASKVAESVNRNELSESLTDYISSPSDTSSVDLIESRSGLKYATVSLAGCSSCFVLMPIEFVPFCLAHFRLALWFKCFTLPD